MKEPLEELIARSLGIPAKNVMDDLEFESIPQWDSINHINLILAIEEAYDVEIEAEQIVELTSVPAIRGFTDSLRNGTQKGTGS